MFLLYFNLYFAISQFYTPSLQHSGTPALRVLHQTVRLGFYSNLGYLFRPQAFIQTSCLYSEFGL